MPSVFPEDYTPSSFSLTFTALGQEQCGQVELLSDSNLEDTHSFNATVAEIFVVPKDENSVATEVEIEEEETIQINIMDNFSRLQ